MVSLRFGLVVEGNRFTRWHEQVLAELDRAKHRLSALIVLEHLSSGVAERHSRHALWRAFEKTIGRTAVTQSAPDDELRASLPILRVKVTDRYHLDFPSTAIRALRQAELDFVLVVGPFMPTSAVVKSATLGCWILRHGDGIDSGGYPPVVSEVLIDARVTAISLLQVTSVCTRVLCKGWFAIEPHSYRKTLNRAIAQSADFVSLACRDASITRLQSRLEQLPMFEREPVLPSNALVCKLVARMWLKRLKSLPKLVFFRREWNIGLLDRNSLKPTEKVCARNVKWLKKPDRAAIAADPFLIEYRGAVALLGEVICNGEECGHIGAWRLDDRIVYLGTAISEEGVHLSYPYSFEWNGDIYCLPERSQVGAPWLYRLVEFPLGWEPVGEILDGVKLVDPSVFFSRGYWWLAGTDASIDPQGRLLLYYSSNPIGGWRPHLLNPVAIDPRCSRGAGHLFIWRGELFRPAQDCAQSYGRRIIFNRIVRLTPCEFVEEPTGMLNPSSDGEYPEGLHTISQSGSLIAIDGLRSVFEPIPLRKLIQRWHRIRRARPLSLIDGTPGNYTPSPGKMYSDK
jgi:hypothetical protein